MLHWLIECSVFPRTAPRVCERLTELGVTWTEWTPDLPAFQKPRTSTPVVFWGSLGSAYVEEVAEDYSPGAVGRASDFAVSVYQAQMPTVPFSNRGSVFSTVRQLAENAEQVLSPMGSPERFFVRPDSALKPFSGRVLETASVSLAALDHGFYYEDDALPVVVSPCKAVGREWRMVVVQGQIVAGSEYAGSREGVGEGVPEEVRALGEQVAGESWQPADAYMVDVAEVDGVLEVMELNPFSGADLYDCDVGAISAALEQWVASNGE